MEQRANSIPTRLAATSSTRHRENRFFPARACRDQSLLLPEVRCSSTTKDRDFLFLCCPESGITPVLPVWHFISEVETPRFRVRGGRNGKKQIGQLVGEIGRASCRDGR